MADYSKMTSDDYERHFIKVLGELTKDDILGIEGVAEIVYEELNNEVLDSWLAEQEEGQL